jgi:hypothetical protein
MIIFEDCIDTECEIALTSPDQISVDIIRDLFFGLLHNTRNALKSLCPNLVSQIFE